MCRLPHQFVLLVGADEQRRGESVKTVLSGVQGSLPESKVITLGAPMVDVLSDGPDKGPQTVVVLLMERQCDFSSIFPETVSPGPVFGEGVNIGVVPEALRLDALQAQGFNTHVAARGATGMHQQLHFDHLRDILYNKWAEF